MVYVVYIRFNKRLRVKKLKVSKSNETFSAILSFLVKTPSVLIDVCFLPQTRCLNHSVYASLADAHVTVFRTLLRTRLLHNYTLVLLESVDVLTSWRYKGIF